MIRKWITKLNIKLNKILEERTNNYLARRNAKTIYKTAIKHLSREQTEFCVSKHLVYDIRVIKLLERKYKMKVSHTIHYGLAFIKIISY